MVRGGHAAAELARRGREVGRRHPRPVAVAADAGVLAQVGADARVVPGVREEEVLAERGVPRLVGVDPEAVAVAAVEGQHLARGQLGTAPRGRREDRRGEPVPLREPLQREEVPGLVVELVLELDRDHPARRTAVRRELGAQRGEPLVDEREVGGIVGAVLHRGILHPVGEPAVAHLAVAPRADAQHHVEPEPLAERHERGHVEPAAEVAVPALGLVVVPEHVGRDHGDAAGAHEAQALLPLVAGHAAVVHLARDRDRRAPLDLDVPVRERDAVVPVGRVAQRRPCEGALVRSVRHAERARGTRQSAATGLVEPGETGGGADVTTCGSFDCVRSQFYHGGARVHSRAWPPQRRRQAA